MGIIESEDYKLVIGMDILQPLQAVVDLERGMILLRDTERKRFALTLVSKYSVMRKEAYTKFRRWQKH